MNYKTLFKKITPYKLSRLLNIPASTIYSWKKNGIPAWRVIQIKAAADKIGIDVLDCSA